MLNVHFVKKLGLSESKNVFEIVFNPRFWWRQDKFCNTLETRFVFWTLGLFRKVGWAWTDLKNCFWGIFQQLEFKEFLSFNFCRDQKITIKIKNNFQMNYEILLKSPFFCLFFHLQWFHSTEVCQKFTYTVVAYVKDNMSTFPWHIFAGVYALPDMLEKLTPNWNLLRETHNIITIRNFLRSIN